MQRCLHEKATNICKGSGLGLATVHGIIQQHGGTLALKSAMNEGTTFLITLARAIETSDAMDRPRHATPPSGHERILVVEDDQAVREFAQIILSSSNRPGSNRPG